MLLSTRPIAEMPPEMFLSLVAECLELAPALRARLLPAESAARPGDHALATMVRA
jgi:hypothetical protein